jgi:hypothetical protein
MIAALIKTPLYARWHYSRICFAMVGQFPGGHRQVLLAVREISVPCITQEMPLVSQGWPFWVIRCPAADAFMPLLPTWSHHALGAFDSAANAGDHHLQPDHVVPPIALFLISWSFKPSHFKPQGNCVV